MIEISYLLLGGSAVIGIALWRYLRQPKPRPAFPFSRQRPVSIGEACPVERVANPNAHRGLLRGAIHWIQTANPIFVYSALFIVTILSALPFVILEERAFNAMTLAEHLRAARKARIASATGEYGDPLRHVLAIPPGAPEAIEAKHMEQELAIEKEWSRQAAAKGFAAEREAEERRASAVRSLQIP